MMVKRYRETVRIFILVLAAAVILTGCQSGNAEEKAVTLTVLTDAINEETFARDYANLYSSVNPGVEFNFISAKLKSGTQNERAENWRALVAQHNPDILLTNSSSYELLVNDNYLYPLEILIEKDKFDLDSLHPPVIDYLKSKGMGKLYGLSYYFQGTGLFYNKDLFDQFQIEYPRNDMTWEEVLQLAKRFPTTPVIGDERIFGLSPRSYLPTPYDMVNHIAELTGVTYFDSASRKLSLDTPSWKKLFEMTVEAYKAGAIYDSSVYTPSKDNLDSQSLILQEQNLFLVGKSAMTVDYSYLPSMIDLNETPINWEVVTVPSDPLAPNQSYGVNVDFIFSIFQKSEHLEEAWDFIRYFNGDEYAKSISKTSYQLFVRSQYSLVRGDKSIAAFYEKQLGDRFYSGLDHLAGPPMLQFRDMFNRELKSLIEGESDLDAVLPVIQKEGETILFGTNSESGGP